MFDKRKKIRKITIEKRKRKRKLSLKKKENPLENENKRRKIIKNEELFELDQFLIDFQYLKSLQHFINLEILSQKKKYLVNIQISGGCTGSDYCWNENARSNEITFILSFEGHFPKIPEQKKSKTKIVKLSKTELESGVQILKITNKKLKRRVNFSSLGYVQKLLIRNYFAVKYATSVYAIGFFEKKKCKDSVNIRGGTAWGCQAYIEMNKGNTFRKKLFFFDQDTSKWFQCLVDRDKVLWDNISLPPKPSKYYCAIGTRNLRKNGMLAIKKLLKM
jgi:hypothetical protein